MTDAGRPHFYGKRSSIAFGPCGLKTDQLFKTRYDKQTERYIMIYDKP